MRLEGLFCKWTRIVAGIVAAGSLAVLGGWYVCNLAIGSAVTKTATIAMARHGGDRVQALTAEVACEACSLSSRNRAVWALGQLRDRRALPVLRKYYTAAPCLHERTLCQHELKKALRWIEGPEPPVWLGYRNHS